MSITIHNLKNEKPTEPYDFYVDRRSPVGNPFEMQTEKDRDKVCDYYAKYMAQMLECESKDFCMYIKSMMKMLKEYGKLRLFCWCSPKRCHAEELMEYIGGKVFSP